MNSFEISSYRVAFICYLLLFLLLTFSYWGKGDVIAPYRQLTEVALTDYSGTQQIENHKFSDFSNGYIPVVTAYLNDLRSGWLALWINKNELGRPLNHLCGFSPAYLPSWIIARFTNNPWRFITFLSLSTCFFSGIFVLLFCREIGISPLAGLISGISLSASPMLMYWLTFPMFPAVWCWAAGALWAITRLADKQDFVGWFFLAFSGYSMLMTAYPQLVIYHAYMLGVYGLHLAHRKQRTKSNNVGIFFILVASALIVAIACALPVYIDLTYLAAESNRVAPDVSFFTAALPVVKSPVEALRFFILNTTPELFGNPIEESYPYSSGAAKATPFIIFFALIGVIVSYSKNWGWCLAIVFLTLLAFNHALYILFVKYLGFNLSITNPLGNIILPFTILVAYGADALVKRTCPGELSRVVWIAVACDLAMIVAGLSFGLAHSISIRWDNVLAMLLLIGLLAAQHQKTQTILMIVALITVLLSISYPLMLRQDPTQIATTSPLVEMVREHLPEDSRFAIAKPGLPVLPPNFNAGLGLASVHSYDSLSSKGYLSLIKALGGEVITYGRWNDAIAPDYNSAIFWMSNISLMLSPTPLIHENLEYLGEESGIYLHKVISRMGNSLQVILPQTTNMEADDLNIGDPRFILRHIPAKLLDQGDRLEYEVVSGTESVLVLSQKFHRDWQAQALVHSGWISAKTTVINGVFQGVLLTPEVQRVQLVFKPYARYTWITHLFWLFLFALLLGKAWKKNGNWISKK